MFNAKYFNNVSDFENFMNDRMILREKVDKIEIQNAGSVILMWWSN